MASDYERVEAALEEIVRDEPPQASAIAADALALLRQMREDFERYGWHATTCETTRTLRGRDCTCAYPAARERLGLR